jgi:hypothetical protein
MGPGFESLRVYKLKRKSSENHLFLGFFLFYYFRI